MKHLLTLILAVASIVGVKAQVTSQPSPLQPDSRDIWIYFHADEGNQGLMGQSASDPVYAHTGVCTNLGDWRYAPAWLDNSAKYKLEYVEPNLWRLYIGDIRSYYGITDPDETPLSLAFVFRNSTGTKEGKTASGGDIFLRLSNTGYDPTPATEKPYPGGRPQMGARANGDGSVTFCLAAPQKTSVSIVGSWNDYAQGEESAMYVDRRDGIEYFWQTISGIKDGTDYLYYYVVDGFTKVGDPYARLVLDPASDKYIPADVFPGLPAYPEDKVQNVCLALYNSEINSYAWQVKNFKGPKKEDLVIYELLLRDFTGTEGKALGDGNVRLAMEKIPYLKQLGVNAVELLPITEFNGNISWGYNPNFYFAPDKAYGTPDDYKAFIDECHRQGIAVILDMVFNQSDWHHPWYRMYPAGENPMYNASAPHAYSVLNDFNQGHPLVRQQWADCVKYWLEEYRVDGFRFDLVKGLGNNDSYANSGDAATNAFNQSRIDNMRAIQEAMNEVNPDAYFINENLAGAEEENAMAAFGQLNWSNLNHQGGQFAMGYQDNSGLEGFYAPNWGRTWGSTVSYLESHDEQRLAWLQRTYGVEEMKKTQTAMQRLGAAAAQMLLTPGAHMIWQFSEMGCGESTKAADGSNNTDPKTVCWSLLDNKYRKALMENYAQLIAIRTDNPELFDENASFTSELKSSNWAKGRVMKSTSGQKAVYTFINPLPDQALILSASFPEAGGYRTLSATPGAENAIDYTAGKVTLPANSYISVGTQAVNAVETLPCAESPTEETTEYYNLQGYRIERGATGETVIVRKGGKTYKAIAE